MTDDKDSSSSAVSNIVRYLETRCIENFVRKGLGFVGSFQLTASSLDNVVNLLSEKKIDTFRWVSHDTLHGNETFISESVF